jgi:tetratricopeptide (TPR) repeat protein
MRAFEPRDIFCLRATEGWLELGNRREASLELDELAADLRGHPDALELRWRIQAAARNWEACVDIASALIAAAPDRPSGWNQRSYALHALNRTEEACANLLPVVDRFPADPFIHYNLACYECCLGRLPEAWGWLQQALWLGDAGRVRLAALSDPELRPLWPQIGGPCESAAPARLQPAAVPAVVLP